MPSVAVRIPAAAPIIVDTLGTSVFIVSRKKTVKLPITDPATPHDGLVGEWVEESRPGQKPYSVRLAPRLRSYRLSAMLTAPNERPMDALVMELRDLADAKHPLTVSYGPLEAGLWNITDLAANVVERDHLSNAGTVINVTITFTEALAIPSPGWLEFSAGRRKSPPGFPAPSKPKKKHGKKRPRSYTVKAGDTLSRLAARFCGDADEWHHIAEVNKIRDPRKVKLKVGTKLKIPC